VPRKGPALGVEKSGFSILTVWKIYITVFVSFIIHDKLINTFKQLLKTSFRQLTRSICLMLFRNLYSDSQSNFTQCYESTWLQTTLCSISCLCNCKIELSRDCTVAEQIATESPLECVTKNETRLHFIKQKKSSYTNYNSQHNYSFKLVAICDYLVLECLSNFSAAVKNEINMDNYCPTFANLYVSSKTEPNMRQ
jgi:hypothetical protein